MYTLGEASCVVSAFGLRGGARILNRSLGKMSIKSLYNHDGELEKLSNPGYMPTNAHSHCCIISTINFLAGNLFFSDLTQQPKDAAPLKSQDAFVSQLAQPGC